MTEGRRKSVLFNIYSDKDGTGGIVYRIVERASTKLTVADATTRTVGKKQINYLVEEVVHQNN